MIVYLTNGRFNKYLSEEELKSRPTITKGSLVRIGRYLLPYWRQMSLVLVTILASSVLSILPAILTGRIIDEGLLQNNLGLLIKLIALSLIVSLASNLLGVLESYINTWVGQRITFDMRNEMFDHLQEMPHEFFTSNNQGDIITRMTNDISGVQQLITGTLTSILSNVIILMVALFSMYSRNWILATLGVIIIPLFVLPTKKVGKKRWQITKEAQGKTDELNTSLNEKLSVSGQLLVKLFNKEEDESQSFQKINREMMALNLKERMTGRWFRVVLSTFSHIGPMLIYLVGGILMIKYKAQLTVGDIMVLVALLGRMYSPVNQLMSIQVDWIRSMALFNRIFEYFDMPVTIKNVANPVVPENFEEAIEFKNVGFAYNQNKTTLKHVNLKIEKGKKIALVGPSGAGKSTIINLLPRLFDVSSGEILMDGINIKQLDLKWLRNSIGMVTQETYLFNGSILDNLLYAKPEATEAELIDACKKANIYDFIRKQPAGFDSLVGNRGLKLSGGEKQRISIARVLLKNPPILILDEATSSLDSISEGLIQTALDDLTQNRTTIVIAHRLSTVLSSDEILVTKDGEIQDRGDHRFLLEHSPVYRDLYRTQMAEKESDRLIA